MTAGVRANSASRRQVSVSWVPGPVFARPRNDDREHHLRYLAVTLLLERHLMGITVAVMAQGTMGAGVGKRLHERGAEVRTLLSGRSEASAGRAKAAGMNPAADERELLAGADYFLSILPPAADAALWRRGGPALQ